MLIRKIRQLKESTKVDLHAANEEVKKDALKAKARKKEETAAATAAAKATKKEETAAPKAEKERKTQEETAAAKAEKERKKKEAVATKAEKIVTKKKLSLKTNLNKILKQLSVFLEKPGTDKKGMDPTEKDHLILMILIIIYYNNSLKSGKMRVDSTRILEEIQNQSKDNIIEKYNYAMKKLFGEEANLQLIGATNIKNLSEQLKTILQKMK
jgi:hypothetical protein